VTLRHSACFLAAASLILASRVASAGATPPIVRVYVAGPPEAVSGSRDAVQDLCSRSNVAVVVRDAAGADEALLSTQHAPGLAEAYVDLRPGSPPRVVVVDGETRQDLERRTLPEGSSLEISIETVARVVCSAVESSLAARAAATSKREGGASSQHAERRSPWDPRVSLFGAAEDFGAGFHGGGGAAVGLTYGRSPLRVGALLSVAGFAAADVEAEAALASFGMLGVRLLPMLEWRASSDTTAFFGLGGGGDWTRVSAKQAPFAGAAADGGATFDAIGSAMLGARLRLTGNLSALLALDADIDLMRHRYVITSAEGSRPFFEPSRVRPMALAGLSFSFGGPGPESGQAQREEPR
jgi:hypothetical protein